MTLEINKIMDIMKLYKQFYVLYIKLTDHLKRCYHCSKSEQNMSSRLEITDVLSLLPSNLIYVISH